MSFDPATHIAVLPYSSGTTGIPKGVMLTHRNLVANVQQSRANIDLQGTDRVLAVLPFFHIYGMTVLLNLALRQRASLVTMPKFDLVEFLTNIQTYGCTYLYIAPPIAVALAKHPIVDQFDISTVHTVFSGAAPLDGETAEAAGRRIHARMMQGYGMSELSPVSHAMPYDRDDIPVSSVGTLLPNQECKLIDTATGEEITEIGENGETLPGEIWVKGPNVMLGYLNKPDATAETLDADGFLHTGDVGVYHEGGYFSIVDRVKELIKYKGYQIAPAELEALLLSHPKIMDAAVIGVLDEDKQEIPKAFIVAAPDSGLTEDDVKAFVAEQVAPHKKVRRVEFIDAIPKSTSGKILRKDLRARETAPSPDLGAARSVRDGGSSCRIRAREATTTATPACFSGLNPSQQRLDATDCANRAPRRRRHLAQSVAYESRPDRMRPANLSRHEKCPRRSGGIPIRGPEGTRTPDPLDANEVRYQLRHRPINLR